MIFFAEINKSGEDHYAVNLAMAEILLKNDKNLSLKLFAEKKHLKNLQSNNEKLKEVEYKIIPAIQGRFFIWPIKSLIDFFTIFTIFSEAKKKKAKFIFFCSLFPLSHISYILVRPFYKNINVIIALHGELQLIDSKKLKDQILSHFLIINLKKESDKKTQFLVYSEMIKENLEKILTNINKRILTVDHPYNYSYTSSFNKTIQPITFGSIGIASKSKNTHLIFKLAYDLKHLISNGSVKFKILGKSNADIIPYQNNYVDYNFSKKMIPNEVYYHNIKNVDYFIFFYGNDLYSLSPSGVFFDALEYEKPIIGLRNNILTYYFNRFGNLGYLFDNLDEIGSFINNILNEFPIVEYKNQVNNIKKAKKDMSIDLIGKNFWNLIKC